MTKEDFKEKCLSDKLSPKDKDMIISKIESGLMGGSTNFNTSKDRFSERATLYYSGLSKKLTLLEKLDILDKLECHVDLF